MSTIRPLATIAVLAALGVFLALKINEGPAVAVNDQWSQAPLIDTETSGEPPAWNVEGTEPTAIEPPPFGGADGSSVTARSAPSWAEAPKAPSAPSPETTPSFPSLPDLPAAPSEPTPDFDSLPPIQGQPTGTKLATEPAAPAFPGTSAQSLAPPSNQGGTNYGDRVPSGISGGVPSLGSSASAYPSSPTEPSATAGFDAAWEAAQTALDRDELPRAHQMLSQWRGEPGLTPEQNQRVETLLGQLAGSVVYSTEHRLEPPHLVAAGETLATIAQQYDIPWQLLAKINGVAAANGVQPGQTLKVLRGPFDAQVDLARGEIVLLLDDRYAGKFPVRVEGTAPGDGDWRVDQKRLDEVRRPMVGAVVPTAAAAIREPKVVLQSQAGQRVELSASTNPTPGAAGRLTVASNDLADLYDILSVGSSVTIRR